MYSGNQYRGKYVWEPVHVDLKNSEEFLHMNRRVYQVMCENVYELRTLSHAARSRPEKFARRSVTYDEDHGDDETRMDELTERFADATETKAGEAENKIHIAQTEAGRVIFEVSKHKPRCVHRSPSFV
jgi:hypothetical protein